MNTVISGREFTEEQKERYSRGGFVDGGRVNSALIFDRLNLENGLLFQQQQQSSFAERAFQFLTLQGKNGVAVFSKHLVGRCPHAVRPIQASIVLEKVFTRLVVLETHLPLACVTDSNDTAVNELGLPKRGSTMIATTSSGTSHHSADPHTVCLTHGERHQRLETPEIQFLFDDPFFATPRPQPSTPAASTTPISHPGKKKGGFELERGSCLIRFARAARV